MSIRILIVMLCGIVLSACPVSAEIVADFTDGNDDTMHVDAFHGIPGDGWATPWLENLYHTGTPTTRVVMPEDDGYDPLTECCGGSCSDGPYLHSSLTADEGVSDVRYGLARRYVGIAPNALRTIEFCFRIDEDVDSDQSTFGVDEDTPWHDRYQIFDGPKNANTASRQATWQIHGYSYAYGSCPEGCEMMWSFVNGGNSCAGSNLTPEMAVPTGVPLATGATYYFRIFLDTITQTWDGYVCSQIGDTFYEYDSTEDYPDGMGWRYCQVEDTTIIFSSRCSDTEDVREFSVDCIKIVPEPGTIVLLVMGLAMLAMRRARR